MRGNIRWRSVKYRLLKFSEEMTSEAVTGWPAISSVDLKHENMHHWPIQEKTDIRTGMYFVGPSSLEANKQQQIHHARRAPPGEEIHTAWRSSD